MNRKIILVISILALTSAPFYLGGCSSSDEQKQAEQPAGEEGLDTGELAEDGGAANPESTADTSGLPEDLAGSPEGGEAAPPPAEAAPSDSADDIVADLGDDPTGEAEALPEQPMGGADQAAADTNVPPPADEMAVNDSAAPPPLMDEPAPAPKASLKKVKDSPFRSNGRILNTVYVARKGDKLNQVAERLLGDKSRKKELVADNSFLSRGVKEGDKIYYNSPRRPDDTTTMMTYYEDNGVAAQSYVAQDGDDLKKVAKTLLGSRDAWKELWSTNPNLESKGALDAGTEIRYWPAGTTVAAAAPPPAPPAPVEQPPTSAGTVAPPDDLNSLPPPDSLPPPPPAPSDMAMAPPPPPPPPPPTQDQVAMNDFPPPPPPAPGANNGANKKPASPEAFLFQDQETTLLIGTGAIILLFVILIGLIRIKKSRAQRMRLGQTQI